MFAQSLNCLIIIFYLFFIEYLLPHCTTQGAPLAIYWTLISSPAQQCDWCPGTSQLTNSATVRQGVLNDTKGRKTVFHKKGAY